MHTISLFFLCLLVTIVPWEENFVIPGLVSAARILGLLAFALGILKVMIRGGLRTPPRAMIWFALFIVWCMLAASWSIDPEATFERATTYVLLFTFVWLIWEVADTPGRQRTLMRAFVVGTAVLVFNVYLNSVGHGVSFNDGEGRATAQHANPNGVAIMCCMAIQFAFFLITRREKGKFELPDWFYWGFIAAAGIAIPMTGSRVGVITTLIVALAFLPVLRQAMRRSGWRNAVMLLVIVAVIGIVVSRLASTALIERLAEGTKAHTVQTRVDAWKRGLRAWSETPLLGTGPGTYAFAGLVRGEIPLVAHNTFVGVLVEYGVVGFVLYFAFWVFPVRRISRIPGKDRFFWLVFLMSLLPSLMSGSQEYAKWWWLIGALILCAAANPMPTLSADRRFFGYPVRTPGTALRPPRPSGS